MLVVPRCVVTFTQLTYFLSPRIDIHNTATNHDEIKKPPHVLEPLTLYVIWDGKKNTDEPHTFIPRQLKPIFRVYHDTTLPNAVGAVALLRAASTKLRRTGFDDGNLD
jgi:hypothetical protein